MSIILVDMLCAFNYFQHRCLQSLCESKVTPCWIEDDSWVQKKVNNTLPRQHTLPLTQTIVWVVIVILPYMVLNEAWNRYTRNQVFGYYPVAHVSFNISESQSFSVCILILHPSVWVLSLDALISSYISKCSYMVHWHASH